MRRLVLAMFLAFISPAGALLAMDGFINKNGQIVIEPRYAMALDFSEGLAPVRIGAKCGYIDREGKERIPLQFDNARRFREGRAAVKVNGKWGFIDQKGQWVVEPSYVEASNFSEGLAAVWIPSVRKDDAGKSEGKPKEYRSGNTVFRVFATSAGKALGGWGFIDISGKLVIPNQFFAVRDFSNGLALVRPRGGSEIGLNSAEVASLESSGVDYLQKRFVVVGKYAFEAAGYIDKTGTMVIPPRFSTALPFREGLAYVDQFTESDGSLRGYIDTTGKTVIQLYKYAARPTGGELHESLLQNEQVAWPDRENVNVWGPVGVIAIGPGPMAHKEGLALVDSGAGFVHVPKWTFMDTNGQVVSEKVGEFSSSFSEGLAAVRKGGISRGKTGYVDRTGKLVIPYQYVAGGDFAEGVAPVQIDKKWGYIDPTGKIVIEPRFEMANSFREGLARVTVPNQLAGANHRSALDTRGGGTVP